MALRSSVVDTRSGRLARVFSFPNPVDEVSTRLFAGGVVILATAGIAFDPPWIAGVLFYEFLARILSGSTLSPLGQVVTRVIRPRLRIAPRLVAGPPKRFGLALGFVATLSAAVLGLGYDARGASQLLLGGVLVVAALDAVFGYCLGCKIFALLMRKGVIPDDVCERCSNIRLGGTQL
ncbi:MAG: DUF4395 domain-containing protein [bacterium]